jgi:filamentous hemagglutinin
MFIKRRRRRLNDQRHRQQTVVGSTIAGRDVNIIARGAGDQSTINVIGSSVTATRDLTLSAPGAITFRSAQEIDTSSSKNTSTGFDIGVTLSASGLSPNASLNLGKGNSSGRDVTNIESILSAGGTARVVTPGALTLEGAQLSGNRVEVQAGSLSPSPASKAHRPSNPNRPARGTDGNPALGTITVTGSEVTAGRDLTLAAPGAITVSAAQETDTQSSRNSSSGASLGATISSQGLTVTASGNLSRGNSSGTDVTNIESALSAGRNATVTTPGALTLSGSVLTGDHVDIKAGSLTIESLQDTSTFTSRQNSVGGSVGYTIGTGQVSVSGSYGRERQNGSFASVNEQAGITAGTGGYAIDVAGATALTGGVIASSADPANNRLTTGTLTTSDIENRETFSASSVNLSGGVSFGNAPACATR